MNFISSFIEFNYILRQLFFSEFCCQHFFSWNFLMFPCLEKQPFIHLALMLFAKLNSYWIFFAHHIPARWREHLRAININQSLHFHVIPSSMLHFSKREKPSLTCPYNYYRLTHSLPRLTTLSSVDGSMNLIHKLMSH